MWSDNETNRDFLNFKLIADTAAEMIVQADGRPLSLGVSGSWGVGKSSMIRLIEDSLRARNEKQFLFVEFNAWLYQGFDDARAALMDVISRALLARAEETKTGIDKAKELLARVDWLRVAGAAAGPAISLALGLPPTGLLGRLLSAGKRLWSGRPDSKVVDEAVEAGGDAAWMAQSLIKPMEDDSPPKEIQELRKHFEEAVAELKVTLVVLIDDLDRCLPATSIATLEAVRLFLFLQNTAFVIAADDRMIRYAVRVHFRDLGIDDDLVTSYFDKLIQVPIRVPPLGTQDVRAYMMLLFVENSGLKQEVRDDLRQRVCRQLGESWQGKRVDRAFMTSLIPNCPTTLMARFDTADRLAPLMTSSKQIAGNPRLIKRFLNTLWIRMSIAKAQGVAVDEAVLAKLLLLERVADETVYGEVVAAINNDDEGKPRLLKTLEEQAIAGEELTDVPSSTWSSDFFKEWLAMPPYLADVDMRPAVYVSRDRLPLITAADQLSSDAAEILAALLEVKQATHTLKPRIAALSRRETGVLMERLLARARQVQEWGNPPILYACLAVADADPEQGKALAVFLGELSVKQLRPAIVPLIGERPWAAGVFNKWKADNDTLGPVKKAIEQLKGDK